jgi:thymidylate synthase
LYPFATERRILNTSAVKQYAPELLARYGSDAAFRQSVDLRLQYTNENVAFAYYQGQAEAHKAAILAFQSELEKLSAAGKLDKLTPLLDQFQQHPERRQIVQSVWDRISVEEQAGVEKAKAEGSSKLEKEYQFAFQLIRGEAAQQR